MIHDFCVIGGGIVGLATARELLRRRPGASLVLVEKENGFARHQTGHNSGVIHAGVYYAPGSLKAELCKAGAAATKAFATEYGIPFETCGKLIVATDESEIGRMAALHERALQNGLEIERLSAEALREREPNIDGVGALLVPSSGIIDYRQVSEKMAELARRDGADIRLSCRVTAIRESAGKVDIDTTTGAIEARQLIVCGGLQSDRLAQMAGLRIEHRIVPFRGEYYRLDPARSPKVNHLIYPVPDPALPFLGIHLTRMIDGSVTVGPNAVLGFAREGYAKGSVNVANLIALTAFSGFWRLLWRNRKSGFDEMRNSLSRRRYLEACRKYCPSLTLADLGPYPAGIRAQAVLADGTLVQDFLFQSSERMLHVCNAPSPAATSAMPIAAMIADRALTT